MKYMENLPTQNHPTQNHFNIDTWWGTTFTVRIDTVEKNGIDFTQISIISRNIFQKCFGGSNNPSYLTTDHQSNKTTVVTNIITREIYFIKTTERVEAIKIKLTNIFTPKPVPEIPTTSISSKPPSVMTPNSTGQMTFVNGATYGGQDYNDQIHGQRTMNYPNGDTYTGNWELGKKSGLGTMEYANGDRYTGEWENNERKGFGQFTQPNGYQKTGVWDDTLFMGNIIWPNNAHFNGTISEGHFDGDVTLKNFNYYRAICNEGVYTHFSKINEDGKEEGKFQIIMTEDGPTMEEMT